MPTKDEQAKIAAEQAKQAAIDAKNQEIKDEADYLKTLTNVQWFIYPFFKTIEVVVEKTFGCCKSERLRRDREPPVTDVDGLKKQQ